VVITTKSLTMNNPVLLQEIETVFLVKLNPKLISKLNPKLNRVN